MINKEQEERIRANMRSSVEAGFKHLDTDYPGWDQHIDVAVLDMGNPEENIFSMVAHWKHDDPRCLSMWEEEVFWYGRAIGCEPHFRDYGFTDWSTDTDLIKHLYGMLTDVWVDALILRRSRSGAPS